jgi:hypothetical protein
MTEGSVIPGQEKQDMQAAREGLVLGIRPASEGKELLDVPGFLVTKGVPERIRGCFNSGVHVNNWTRMNVSSCCTANGARALYYAWRSILTKKDNLLRINLLLNRASAWADIDSHIPYRGQVDVYMKQPMRLQIRIPFYVDKPRVTLRVNEEERQFNWLDRYIDVGFVGEGQKVGVEFPLETRTVTVDGVLGSGEKAKFTLKGNDVIDVEPKGSQFPLYQRDKYRRNETQWREVTRFAPEEEFLV